MPRKHYEWKLRDKTLQLGERTLVMGILNVTPDSFSDGGKYSDPDRAFARAMELEEQGADIIDIGAESMRPGSARVTEAEELRRLVPVLKRLQGRLTVPLSVDTYKSGVASKALELGADIINDPTGLTADAELARAAIKANAGLILNHMRGTPETWAKLPPLKDPLASLAMELDSAMHRAVREGLERKRIVIDPGLGFGKRKEQNSEILARLDELAVLDLPIMVGPSRKHFLAREAALETEFATAAAVAAAVLYGAHIVRVHDVRTMKTVVEVADEIARARAAREAARQEASRQEASRQSGSRPGGPRETRSAGGPREARPPGSRPDEGSPGPQRSGFYAKFVDAGPRGLPREVRQPLRPPAPKPAVSHGEPTADRSTPESTLEIGDSGPRKVRPSMAERPGVKGQGPKPRDARYDDRRSPRGGPGQRGPRQGPYGRPPGPPRSDRSSPGSRADRPTRSDRPARPPRSGKPFTPRRPQGGRPPGRRPPGRG